MSSIFIWNCTFFTVFKDAFCTIITSVLIKITEHYLDFKLQASSSHAALQQRDQLSSGKKKQYKNVREKNILGRIRANQPQMQTLLGHTGTCSQINISNNSHQLEGSGPRSFIPYRKWLLVVLDNWEMARGDELFNRCRQLSLS